MGRVTSDVIRGMSVTQFIGVGHIAILGRVGSAFLERVNGLRLKMDRRMTNVPHHRWENHFFKT